MGSRAGSLIVLFVLAAIVIAAVLLVVRFSGDSDPEQPAIIVSLINDQPVLLGQPLEVEVRARSGVPISIFTLLADGAIITQATPIYDPDQGRYAAVLFWTPQALGFANLRIVATDTAGAQTEVAVRVDVTDDAERVAQAEQAARTDQPQTTAPPPAAPTEDDPAESGGEPAEQPEATPQTDTPSGGTARILSPQDGARYELGSGERFDVELETSGTGPLASVLFYVTPVLADGSFGRSQLAHAANPDVAATGGVYRETVRGVEQWFPRAGTYDLQLVALTSEQQRFEDLIRVTVGGAADGDDDTEDSLEEEQSNDQLEEGQQSAEGGSADLAIVTVRQNPNGIAVTIINTGNGAAERVEIELSLIRTRDASLLASTRALLTLAAEQRANIPLEFSIDESTDALVVLELQGDADASNNTFQLVLSPSSESESGGDQPEEEPTLEEEDEEDEQPPPPPEDLPDLAFLEARFTDDGYALLTVVNAGEADAGEFAIHVVDANGELLETISRGAGASPLPPRGSEILAGAVAHSGSVEIILDPDNTTAESNESNNLIRVEVNR